MEKLRFNIGDRVEWESQASGTVSHKRGNVVLVVPANVGIIDHAGVYVFTPFAKKVLGGKYRASDIYRSEPRSEESYVVDVGGKLYWPRRDYLKIVRRARK